MIPYFSLEMLRALLELYGIRIPGMEDPHPVSSNHVKTHATARALRPGVLGNEEACRPGFWREPHASSPLE
jgi:hypothetical protein